MKKVQENSILDKLPLEIKKLFMSRDEKEKLKASQELEQWAKSNNLSPERAKAMAAVLAKVDPDTGHVATGANTGNIDESDFDAIKASPNKFTNWEYIGPKNPSLPGRILAKGRNANEAALYVSMRYPEYPNPNPQYFKDTDVVISIIDNFVKAIYDGKTEAPERGETPFFMKEMKAKLKDIVKELMEADMPPPPVYAPIKNVDASPIVKAIQSGQLSLQQITNISSYLSKRTAFQPSVKDGELGDAVVDFLNKNEVSNQILQPIIDQLPKQDVMYTGPGMKETKNKTKMNKKDLMEMIREVIAEEMGSSATDVNNYKVTLNNKSGYTPLEFTVPMADAKDLEGIQDGTFLNDKFKTSTFDVNNKYKVSTMTQEKEDGTIIRTLRIFDIGDGKIKESKIKVNQLRQIIREEIAKALNEQTNRVGWDKGYSVGVEFNEKLAQLLTKYLETGTITKDELETAANQAKSEGYGEWDAIIGSKSKGPYAIKMFNGNIQISGTKGKNISKNMQSSFDKYGTDLGGK